MRNTAITRTLAAVLLSAVLIGMTGCGDKQLVKQIDSFQKSIEKTSAAITIYYTELNELERERYLDRRRFDTIERVLMQEDDEAKTATAFAKPRFSPKSIKARTDAIAMLGKYGEELTKLAGNDSPKRFKDETATLGSNLGNLATTFKGLISGGDATATNYSEPLGALGKIVGEIGSLALKAKRDKALREAVDKAAPQVRIIIGLLETDLDTYIKPLTDGVMTDQVSLRRTYYNTHRNSMTLEQRKAALDDLLSFKKRHEIVQDFNPKQILQSLSKAHEALVKYAAGGRKIENLAELVASLEEFHETAETIFNAVKTLKELKGDNNG